MPTACPAKVVEIDATKASEKKKRRKGRKGRRIRFARPGSEVVHLIHWKKKGRKPIGQELFETP